MAASALIAMGIETQAIAADMAVRPTSPVVARPTCAQFGGFYVGAVKHDSTWSDRKSPADDSSGAGSLGRKKLSF